MVRAIGSKVNNPFKNIARIVFMAPIVRRLLAQSIRKPQECHNIPMAMADVVVIGKPCEKVLLFGGQGLFESGIPEVHFIYMDFPCRNLI